MGRFFEDVVANDVGNADYWNEKLGGLDEQLDLLTGGTGFDDQSANRVLAGPGSGSAAAPSFRALVADDIPNLAASKVTSGTFDNARINWASPSAIGTGTPAAGTFAALEATGLTVDSGETFGLTLERNGGGANGFQMIGYNDVGSVGCVLQFLAARGTKDTPSASQSGDTLGVFGALGYGTSEFASVNRVRINMNASENWTDSAQGTEIRFFVTANGGTTTALGLALHNDGRLEIEGSLDHDGSAVGFYGTAPASKPTVTGSRGGNAALASLLTGLASLGLVTDSSS